MNLLRSRDIAVDAGTATMRAATATGRVEQQRSVLSETPALKRGVVASREAAVAVLKPLLKKVEGARFMAPRVLVCAPTDASSVEKADLKACLLKAGASAVVIVPEPLAAAVGAQIDIASKYSKLVVDFGEGVTDCALIHRGRVVHSHAVRIGCADLRKSVQEWAREFREEPVSDEDADAVLRKVWLGKGEGPVGDMPFPAKLVRGAIDEPFSAMLECLQMMLKELPPVFGAEVIEDGIFLTGGGALLPGMKEAVTRATGIHACVVPRPLDAVITGARTMLPLAATLRLWQS
jgi:rod shape-determining protein MreB